MTTIPLAARAGLAILGRDWQLFLSYRLRLAAQLLNAVFSLTLFYYLSRLVRVPPFHDPNAYFAFAVVGLIILHVLNATVGGAPGTLRGEVLAGTFERLLVSPFGPVGGLLSMLAFPVAQAMGIGLVMLVFGWAAFDLQVHWATAPLALPAAALAVLAFTPFTVLLLAGTVLLKQAAAGATWVIAAISLVAGLYFPISLLPGWLRWASEVQPFTPAVDLLRHLLVGSPLVSSAWIEVARLAGFAVLLLPLSLGALRLAIEAGRRRGTILEY